MGLEEKAAKQGMKILVMGSGGIGGYLGILLCRKGFDVHFIARGAHLEAMQQNGLTLIGPDGEFIMDVDASDDPSKAGPVDLVLFCVKAYDTEGAARAIKPTLKEHTVVLTLQNGIDQWQKIGEIVGTDRVMAGAIYVFSIISRAGVIHHIGGKGRVIFGELDGSSSRRGERILDTFRHAGIDAELSTDIQKVLWEKFMFICAVAGLTAVTRVPIGMLRSNPITREMARSAMEEVRAVALASSISLDPEIVERTMTSLDGFEPESKTSMLIDLERGRPLEVEALNGTVARIGEELSVETPVNRFIYGCLKVQQEAALKVPQETKEKRQCPECDVELPPDSLYCYRCGAEVSEPPEQEDEVSLDDRIPCADGCCIGILGKDNRCGVCGRTPEEVEEEEQ